MQTPTGIKRCVRDVVVPTNVQTSADNEVSVPTQVQMEEAMNGHKIHGNVYRCCNAIQINNKVQEPI